MLTGREVVGNPSGWVGGLTWHFSFSVFCSAAAAAAAASFPDARAVGKCRLGQTCGRRTGPVNVSVRERDKFVSSLFCRKTILLQCAKVKLRHDRQLRDSTSASTSTFDECTIALHQYHCPCAATLVCDDRPSTDGRRSDTLCLSLLVLSVGCAMMRNE